jgi:hypothetical protein
MAAFTHRTQKNPNENYNVRACSAVGQQKHPDCSGEWTELLHVRASLIAPHVVICDYHLRELAAGTQPKVAEPKPRARRSPAKQETPSL